MGAGMSPKQAGLGATQVLRNPVPDGFKLGRVTRNDEYQSHGRVEVVFLREKGMPTPVWVVESGGARRPAIGDFVLVGFLDEKAENPFLAGFYSNMAYTSNFVYIGGDKVRIQFPTVHADVYDDSQPVPAGPHLTNDANLSTRLYIELDANGFTIHAPSGVPLNIIADGGGTVNINNGTEGVARVGDSVQVNVNGTMYTGSITGGSSTVKAG